MTSHSPAPWKELESNQWVHIADEHGLVASCWRGFESGICGLVNKREKDAKLITQAPRMLAAIQEMVRLKALKEQRQPYTPEEKQAAWDEMRAILNELES